jgi:hypothetical protein
MNMEYGACQGSILYPHVLKLYFVSKKKFTIFPNSFESVLGDRHDQFSSLPVVATDAWTLPALDTTTRGWSSGTDMRGERESAEFFFS